MLTQEKKQEIIKEHAVHEGTLVLLRYRLLS